jgi:hypothetical protein
MWALFIDLGVRFWPYLAVAFAIGAVAGWVSSSRLSA